MTEGELLVEVCYKPFVEDDGDGDNDSYPAFIEVRRCFCFVGGARQGGRPSQSRSRFLQEGHDSAAITDIKTAADASSRAAVAQSAAMATVAVTMVQLHETLP